MIKIRHFNSTFFSDNIKESERRTFSTAGIPKSLKINNLYTRQHQSNLFEKHYGIELDEEEPKNSQYFLARGHLTPDADFIFTSEQFSTYFYLNVAPQFQIINSGNWLKVEKLAREMADYLKVDLEVETGVFGVLQLKDSESGEEKPMYLDDKNRKVPVPAWFYKVLINPQENSGIVFITSNNAFVKSRDELKEVCENTCRNSGVTSKSKEDLKKGYTYCCELNDFRKSLKMRVKNDFNVSKMLNMKNLRF